MNCILYQVKESNWQKIYVDDSLPSNLDTILKKAVEWEQKYLALLKNQGSKINFVAID